MISKKTFKADEYSIYPFKTKLGRDMNDTDQNDNVIEFDKKGFIIKHNIYNYGIVHVQNYEYKFEDYHSQKWIFKYNELNQKIEKLITDKYNQIKSNETYSYSENKMITKIFDYNGYQVTTIENLIDNKGRIVTKKFYDEENDFCGHKNYQFNSKNDIVKELHNNFDESTVYTYDKKRNLLRIEWYVENDSNGFKEFKYKSDSNDNWIEKIEYIKDQPKYIVERRIEYF